MKSATWVLVVACVVVVGWSGEVLSFGGNCGGQWFDTRSEHTGRQAVHDVIPDPGFKAAFFGDQGLGDNPRRVLEMAVAWGADMIVHAGDFDYSSNPAAFQALVDETVGEDFPYFATIGNHDLHAWSGRSGYEAQLISRLARIPGAECWGEYGVNMGCIYKGFVFVLSGVGTRGNSHDTFIDRTFSDYNAMWKFCHWHKNQRFFQVGGKSDETGYEVYDACRRHGAVIATAHEHSYSRTRLITNFATQEYEERADVDGDGREDLFVAPGQTVAWCSGLGGKSIRPARDNLQNNPWIAAWATSDRDVDYGFLGCEFNVDGRPDRAHCTFGDIRGAFWDNFTIHLNTQAPREVEAQCVGAHTEVQISRLEQEELVLRTDDGDVLLAAGQGAGPVTTVLRFEELNVDPTRVETLHLQVLGMADIKAGAELSIRLRPAGSSGEESDPIAWRMDVLGDYDKGEVWVSPNLASLVPQVAASRPTLDAVEIVIQGRGEHTPVYSVQNSPCLAPTLY
eukprot:CAMPEP_0119120138 /NCGR_PEP_ID=MMETSP1310-20130426/1311_1 /TAXON_ID=464262 /ORGANISM="Genus nov. species nov., Strain RCC2339" /LENGTH=508 /DNA_ID=CAMNT_0007109603 /DNA_START=27 /DNA_END=1550 /DNA_ORIENTATION=+